MSDQEKNSSLSALIFGVLIGAAATYLFTTKDGQKVKEKLLKEGSKLLDKVAEGLENVEETVDEKRQEIQDTVSGQIESTKENVEEAVSEIPKHIHEVQKKGRRFFFKKHHAQES